jgi:hypothetical protein
MRVAARLAALAAGLMLLYPLAPLSDPGQGSAPSMRVGYTFSARQAGYLELPWQQTFDATLALEPGLLRLGAYWDEIEPRPGQFDFRSLDWQMDRAAAAGRPVVLTVGMKAPRWPEYFLPAWLDARLAEHRGAISSDPGLRERTLRFVRAVVERYRAHPTLRYWQVENEPLDPSGPRGWFIHPEFLAQEVAAVRAADPSGRPIVLTMFVHVYPLASVLPWSRGDDRRAEALLDLGDVLGLDVYPSVSLHALGRDLYFNFLGWNWTAAARGGATRAHARGKHAWIMEAQAEPWEPARVVASGPGPARSLNPSQAERIFQRLRASGFDTILVWGVEHWYMRKAVQQDSTWWDTGSTMLGVSRPVPASPP